jgi:hypothetical protein
MTSVAGTRRRRSSLSSQVLIKQNNTIVKSNNKHFTTQVKQSLNMSKRSISDVLTANPAATNSKRSKTDESALLLTLDEPSVLALPHPEFALAFFNLRTAYLE